MNHDEMRRRPHHANRGKISRWIISQMPVQTLVDRLRAIGADEQRMAVALRARRFRGGDIAASTRLVLDHNRLPKHGLEVLASSRWKRYEDGDGLAGPSIGRRIRPAWSRRSIRDCGGASQDQTSAS